MFSIGAKVATLKATRHGMIAKGAVGIVVEVRQDGIAPGVVVEFMRLPDPRIAKMFGKPANVPEPFRCLFSDVRQMSRSIRVL